MAFPSRWLRSHPEYLRNDDVDADRPPSAEWFNFRSAVKQFHLQTNLVKFNIHTVCAIGSGRRRNGGLTDGQALEGLTMSRSGGKFIGIKTTPGLMDTMSDYMAQERVHSISDVVRTALHMLFERAGVLPLIPKDKQFAQDLVATQQRRNAMEYRNAAKKVEKKAEVVAADNIDDVAGVVENIVREDAAQSVPATKSTKKKRARTKKGGKT